MKKNIFNKMFLGGALLCAGLMASCDDYLTLLPTDSIPDENFWESKNDVDNVRASAYYQAISSAVTSRILYWGEYRSDNVELGNQSNSDLNSVMKGVLYPTNDMYNWGAFYTGISYCNKVLENGQRMIDENVDPTFSLGEWRPIKAEMTALRALYYFYLVRAYRDVPYVTKTISTDAEALQARQGQPAMNGILVLESLINDLEECKDFAATNYGNSIDNKGRFTKRSVKMLLADMYLWQGCMIQCANKKYDVADLDRYPVKDNGAAVTDSVALSKIAMKKFAKAVTLCDEVYADIKADYQKVIDQNGGISTNPARPVFVKDIEDCSDQIYPLIRFNSDFTSNVRDNVYQQIWGSKNSIESILELQYDGVNNTNSTLVSNFYSSGGGTPTVVANPNLCNATGIDNGALKGFSKTDARLLESVRIDTKITNFPIRKNVYTDLTIINALDMKKGASENSTLREDGTNNANWPIYRLSDLMLIKAECLARLYPKETNTDNGHIELREGFTLVNALFSRYNPFLYKDGTTKVAPSDEAKKNVSDRLKYDFGNKKTGSDLLALVYRERQREFFGEGKRWFDLVREMEYEGGTENILKGWMGANDELQSRLRKYWSIYSPYFNNELKVNPALKQNEVWDRYTPSSSKPTEN